MKHYRLLPTETLRAYDDRLRALVVVDAPLSWWRRLLRYLRGL